MEWLSTEFTKALSLAQQAPSVSLIVKLYITTPITADSPSLSSDDIEKDAGIPTPTDDKSAMIFGDSEVVEVKYGRPNVASILEEMVRGSDGPVSVDVSGPKPLLQDVRRVLSGGFASPLSVLKGVPSVQLNVETFSM